MPWLPTTFGTPTGWRFGPSSRHRPDKSAEGGAIQLAAKAKLIRSKNAGPFQLTFDVMFRDASEFEEVSTAGVITPEVIAQLYGCAVTDVAIYNCPNARAIKVTIPRPRVQGSFGDPDLHGGQQHVPLMNLEVP